MTLTEATKRIEAANGRLDAPHGYSDKEWGAVLSIPADDTIWETAPLAITVEIHAESEERCLEAAVKIAEALKGG